jgi:hypothetical protein
MVRNAWPLYEALDHVKRKRGLVRPNDGFVHQLGVYEVNIDMAPYLPPPLACEATQFAAVKSLYVHS